MTATAAPTTVSSTHDLLGLVRAASAAIDVYSDQLDALNVFPVPDGDTGKNLALTLRGIEEELRQHPQTDFGDTVAFLAKTALMKGRGNSGVILSQLFRGFPAGIGDESALTARGFAESLAVATELSYKAVPEPREGTMLTVYRECADVAKSFVESEGDDADLAQLLKCVADEAMRSVERSPELLEVLKRAGVFDAGGWGLAIIFESMQRHLDGVGAIEPQRRAKVLGQADPEDVADLLHSIDWAEASQTLIEIPNSSAIAELLVHKDEDAGGLMSPDYATLRDYWTARQAVRILKDADLRPEALRQIYVVDGQDHLVGRLELATIVFALPGARISDIMNPDVISVSATDDREEAVRVMERYELVSVPVTNAANQMEGVIGISDLVNVAEQEATEDCYASSASPGR